MKFHFNEVILWLKNGATRALRFEPKKINIITGDSNTGKTAILDIIDYCLFASQHKISDSIINENTSWYGIVFSINQKRYTIIRKAPIGNTVSPDYYFSSIGEVPATPESNIPESALKTALESEFEINQETKIPYGGKALKANSKISLRYFLLFNTISQDIITHSEEFFDKQSNEKYREALPRAFDLAVGIDTAANILKREKREEIERELKKLEREDEKLNRKQDAFYAQLNETVRAAKEFSLIPENVEFDNDVLNLKSAIAKAETDTGLTTPHEHDRLSTEINLLKLKIRNLERFSSEYKKYKSNLKETGDSLQPIAFLISQHDQSIKTSIYSELIAALGDDLTRIKKATEAKTPLDTNIFDTIKSYKNQINSLQEKCASLPRDIKTFESEKKKYIFLGETKAKIALYEKSETSLKGNHNTTVQKLREDLNALSIEPVETRRALFVNVLDETIQEYIAQTQSALENYSSYRSSFNYKEKKLQLRKPKTNFVENVGSSSNHMFLHLFLFLGLHERIINAQTPYVPPFLIIDQFSRPYWGEGEIKKDTLNQSDISKVRTALELLNSFMDHTIDTGNDFQMIVFEHINSELWKNLPHVHLVEEFRNGNALIPWPTLKDRVLN
jgi:hypothetical protein